MKMITVNTRYKVGHAWVSCPTTMTVRNIIFIQKVVEEIPEYADGINASVCLPHGERLWVTDNYEKLAAEYSELMKDEND